MVGMSTTLYHHQHPMHHMEQPQRRVHKRGPWSQAEDGYLMLLVNQTHPHNWVKISEALGSRSAKQCRERYHQNLKPTLNHDPISETEGKLIETMVVTMGKRWADIARKLNGRSDNQVKNWWNGSMNRRKRLEVKRSQHHYQQPQHQHNQRQRQPESLSLATIHEQRRLPPPFPSPYGPAASLESRLPSIKTTFAVTPRTIQSSCGIESPLPSPSSVTLSPGTESTSLPESPTYTTSPTNDAGVRLLPPPHYLFSHDSQPLSSRHQLPPISCTAQANKIQLPPIVISPISTPPNSPPSATGYVSQVSESRPDRRLSVRSLLS